MLWLRAESTLPQGLLILGLASLVPLSSNHVAWVVGHAGTSPGAGKYEQQNPSQSGRNRG